jgi:hypothetical protein
MCVAETCVLTAVLLCLLRVQMYQQGGADGEEADEDVGDHDEL